MVLLCFIVLRYVFYLQTTVGQQYDSVGIGIAFSVAACERVAGGRGLPGFIPAPRARGSDLGSPEARDVGAVYYFFFIKLI